MALLIALIAVWRARGAGKRVERLSESYWELRYETGQLRSRVARLETAAGLRDAEPEPTRPGVTTAFVPLSALKK